MVQESRERLELVVFEDTNDKSHFIAIVKEGVMYRLAASYLTVEAAKLDLEFLLNTLVKKGFTPEKGGLFKT